MAKTKIIGGLEFQLSEPYAEGHTLTAAEARTLNQVRSENIGNNLRKQVEDAKAKGDTSGLAQIVADYDASYSFSTPSAGPRRVVDPVEREINKIVEEVIRNDLKKKGRKITDVPEGMTEDQWNEKLEAVRATQAARDDIIKLARKRVADKQKVADGGDLSDL